ncbi:hypothetical protein DCM91_05610 [Chitinophaga costaii]|nr:hypothetical protein DCM91_05610 [Chitinophaga costaii]
MFLNAGKFNQRLNNWNTEKFQTMISAFS